MDQADLPVSEGSYEVVSCVEVLEHLYDPGHALSEIYRILRLGGTAIVTAPNVEAPGPS